MNTAVDTEILTKLRTKAMQAAQRADWSEARRCWEEVRTRFPNHPAGYLGVGTALREMGRWEEAEALLATAVERFPSDLALTAAYASSASRRRDWREALRRWDQVLARSGRATRPPWQAALAEALLQLGHMEKAEAAFRGALRSDPGLGLAEVGLARIAMWQGRWADALAHWDRALNSAGCSAQRDWHVGRAVALRRLVRYDEADAVLRRLLQIDPGFFDARLQLIQLLTAAGKFEAALGETFAAGDLPALVAQRIDVLIRLQRLGDARAEFRRAVAGSLQPSDLNALFHLVPRLFEGGQRTRVWLLFEHRLRNTAVSKTVASTTATTLTLRVLLALRDYESFLREIDHRGEDEIIGGHRTLLLSIATTLREPGFPDRWKPKVFGIGLSRAGTTPLALALTTLGYAAVHFLNPLTNEMISEAEFDLFDAATDTPVCISFEKLYYLYPLSKFIYTTRPFEHWKAALCEYLERRWGTSDFVTFRKILMRRDSFHFGAPWSAMLLSLYFNHADYEDAYCAYDRRVRNFFRNKSDRFLVFDVFANDGWAKLCSFLGRPIPSQPFPEPLL
jgi:tetratricopeptide (TPR) repeat protein